jgi:hypothetical protein
MVGRYFRILYPTMPKPGSAGHWEFGFSGFAGRVRRSVGSFIFD